MVLGRILLEVLLKLGPLFRLGYRPDLGLPPRSGLQTSPSGLRYKLLEPGNGGFEGSVTRSGWTLSPPMANLVLE